jgi:NAD(P)-dependent dehydrogenase (short-subunit alcohol dehydrogenase family)
MNRLEDRVGIVTGAARGIGKGIALRLLDEGAKVWICDVNGDGIKGSIADLSSHGVIDGGVTDVSDRESFQATIDGVVAKWGKLDFIVNNAGIAHHAALLDVDDANWDRILNVNLRGAFLGTQIAARQFVKQGTGGAIVNIGSTNGLRGQPGLAPYGASKAGIINLSMSAALELGEYGIRVNALCPGTVWDEMSAEAARDTAFWDELRRHTALGRLGVPADIAAAAAFLVSDDAAFMTGQAMVVDGGLTARQLLLKAEDVAPAVRKAPVCSESA